MFILMFRVVIHILFGVQSRFFISTFRAISLVWRSEPHFQFDVQSLCLLFGIQSHVFSSALRVLMSIFFIRHPNPSLSFHFFTFSAIGRTPLGFLSHIFILHFGVQSRFSHPFIHFESPSFLVSAFRVTIASQIRCLEPPSFSISAFRATIILNFGVQSHYPFLFWISKPPFHSQFRHSKPSSFSVSTFRAIIVSQFRHSKSHL